MVPLCVASRLPLSALFVLFLSLVTKNANSVLVYDRQALFNIRFATEKLVKYDLGGQKTSLPPFLSGIPASATLWFHRSAGSIIDAGSNAAACW